MSRSPSPSLTAAPALSALTSPATSTRTIRIIALASRRRGHPRRRPRPRPGPEFARGTDEARRTLRTCSRPAPYPAAADRAGGRPRSLANPRLRRPEPTAQPHPGAGAACALGICRRHGAPHSDGRFGRGLRQRRMRGRGYFRPWRRGAVAVRAAAGGRLCDWRGRRRLAPLRPGPEAVAAPSRPAAAAAPLRLARAAVAAPSRPAAAAAPSRLARAAVAAPSRPAAAAAPSRPAVPAPPSRRSSLRCWRDRARSEP